MTKQPVEFVLAEEKRPTQVVLRLEAKGSTIGLYADDKCILEITEDGRIKRHSINDPDKLGLTVDSIMGFVMVER